MTESFVDVALLAYGGPGSTQQIPDFLQRMTGRLLSHLMRGELAQFLVDKRH